MAAKAKRVNLPYEVRAAFEEGWDAGVEVTLKLAPQISKGKTVNKSFRKDALENFKKGRWRELK